MREVECCKRAAFWISRCSQPQYFRPYLLHSFLSCSAGEPMYGVARHVDIRGQRGVEVRPPGGQQVPHDVSEPRRPLTDKKKTSIRR